MDSISRHRNQWFIIMNDILIIDYLPTLEVYREWYPDEKETIRDLVAWRNREYEKLKKKHANPCPKLYGIWLRGGIEWEKLMKKYPH